MFAKLRKILEMIRFSHTLFALPFALLAALMAWTAPAGDGQTVAFRWWELGGILLCMVFARSAAMAFNRLVDRDVDAKSPRTASRHLPAGELSVASVWTFTILCSGGFVLSTLLFLPNWLPVALSIPVLLLPGTSASPGDKVGHRRIVQNQILRNWLGQRHAVLAPWERASPTTSYSG